MLNADDEIKIQRIIINLLSSFLVKVLPENVNSYVRPFVPERIQNRFNSIDDLKNFDLYCNLKVFLGNKKFFFDANIISDNTIFNCAVIILNWRNKISHRSARSDILETFEQTFLEILSINRFLSLLPVEEEYIQIASDAREETLSISYKLSKDYFNAEYNETTANSSVNKSIDENGIKEEIYSNEDDDENDLRESEVKLSKGEGLQLLRKLRSELSIKYPDIPKYRNILRDSILEIIVDEKIIDLNLFKDKLPKSQFLKTDPLQFQHFNDIKEIIEKIDYL